jgi:tetratricopeptide (TPR) repeat protein
VVALAIALRAAAASSIAQTGHARHPLVDAHTYWSQASALASGGNPFPDGFYQPPGYPLLLSWIQGMGAIDLWGPRLFQLSLGVMTTVCLIAVGRRLGGESQRWVGAAAGALYALYPSTLLFELDLLTPAITSFIMVVLLLLITQTASTWRFGVAGVLAGLSSAVHPSFLIVAGAVCAVGWMHSHSRSSATWATLVGLAIGLMPMTQANIDQFQRARFTSNNAGINFYMGNNPAWKDTAFLRPGLRFRQMALEAEPHKRDGFARNEYWMSRALSDIAAAPHLWLATIGTKALWSVNDTEIPRNEDYRCRTRTGPMAWLGWRLVRYGVVFPFAILGAMLVWRRRSGGQFTVLAWAALHLPVVVFIVADRYRLATWPMMCLLAPFGVGAIRQMLALGKWRVLIVLITFVLPWLPLDERTEVDLAWCAHVDANLAYMDGDMGQAETLYTEAVSLDPGDWSAHSWLSQTLAKRGELSEAIAHLQVVLDGFPDSFPTLRTAAYLHDRNGDPAVAAELMLRAYAVPGERTGTGLKALRMLRRSGQNDRVRELLRRDPKLAERWAKQQ